MAEPEPLPELDRIEGAPHPRETPRMFGHGKAEAAFLAAHEGGRMHHGWLLAGPRGVGKATLAWRMARFLLAQPAPGQEEAGLFGAPEPPASLDLPEDHPVARQMAALSHPGLRLIRRGHDEKKRPRQVITVEEVRGLAGFFGMSSTEGGRRVVIVDAADEMNANAANALLKLLEEPPAGAVLLLVAHQPSRLLPTIRSRCRMLRLNPLGADDIAPALEQALGTAPAADGAAALAALAGGSVGEAVRLATAGGPALYGEIVALIGAMPGMPRPALNALADSTAARGNEARFDMVVRLLEVALARMARRGATGRAPEPQAASGEGEAFARLARDAGAAQRWAALASELGGRAGAGRAVNLDPAALVVDIFLQMEQVARELAR
ncbi:MAG: DNA polymerase III subunit delta' [Pararhodobacter sp.]|nr:DNA polymerase III subunit delta' [Pararhodobacter sp.]